MNARKTQTDVTANRFQGAEFLIAAHRPQDWPADTGAEIAFLGRSNSGKSSAINAITGRPGLARASRDPGRTRQIVFFDLPGGRLVDLPGYGYAKVAPGVRRHWDTVVAAYLETRRCLRGIVLVADMRRGLADAEHGFLDWCGRSDIPLLCLLSKSDKLNRSERTIALRTVTNAHPGLAVYPFSAKSGEGIEAARHALERWFSEG